MTRLCSAIILGVVTLWAFQSPPLVQAACEVQTGTVAYANGTVLGGELCDAYGNRKMTPSTLLSGEDQTNNVMMTNVLPRGQVYTATNAWTPPATPSDLVTITGSASKTVKVQSAQICTTNTAAGSQEFHLIKRSTADTGGTPVAGTVFPLDSANDAGTATVNHYTANPGALGTAVGTVNRVRIASPLAVPGAFTIPSACTDLIPTLRNGLVVQPITLRGIAEQLAINFNGAALVAGQTHTYTLTWIEE